jgi:hypothetical protein
MVIAVVGEQLRNRAIRDAGHMIAEDARHGIITPPAI